LSALVKILNEKTNNPIDPMKKGSFVVVRQFGNLKKAKPEKGGVELWRMKRTTTVQECLPSAPVGRAYPATLQVESLPADRVQISKRMSKRELAETIQVAFEILDRN
jgi:hypothetical protein